MKILAIICEFNPFHNGHKYLIESAKQASDCDAVLCIMSGDFTQRGEMCIFDKYTRARHAVLGGADCVIQLPAAFAVAPAEIFAEGAIKILSAIPAVTVLAFGCENRKKEDFFNAARTALNEDERFKQILKSNLKSGESYKRSYASAFAECGGNEGLIKSPNNILGLEYTKAILKFGAKMDILPILRAGSGYLDDRLADNYSSAAAIRANLTDPAVKNNVPKFVFDDLSSSYSLRDYEEFLRNSLFTTNTETLSKASNCGEGLENKLKELENRPFKDIVELATNKRYPSSRIKRILCANALGLQARDVSKYLSSELYIKPLAIKKTRADEILSELSKAAFNVTTGITPPPNDLAAKCFKSDLYEFSAYNHINRLNIKDYMNLIV